MGFNMSSAPTFSWSSPGSLRCFDEILTVDWISFFSPFHRLNALLKCFLIAFLLFKQVVLETEITNKSALKLYENLGFVRDKRLFRYYLNGVDALRLKLWLR